MSKRITSRDVDCPVCAAPAGERCRSARWPAPGWHTVDYHIGRRENARMVAAETTHTKASGGGS